MELLAVLAALVLVEPAEQAGLPELPAKQAEELVSQAEPAEELVGLD